MMKKDENLFSRNLGLLTENEQSKVCSKTVLIAGCGVGSTIAVCATKIGISKFILIDADKVDNTNLNRQAYNTDNIGTIKSIALKENILKINPSANIKSYAQFVDENNAESFVVQADIIIDAIDPLSQKAILALHQAARKYRKKIILPLDVGWGAKVFVFDKDSITYEKLIGINTDKKYSEDQLVKMFISFFSNISPDYVQQILSKVISGKLSNYPQPSPASYALGSIVSIILKRIILNQQIPYAPNAIAFDAEKELNI